jgi:ABC-type antimicrobial peptide transport system permease subunit
VFLGVALTFAAVALLASFFPARKAARVNPVIALRSE